MPQDQTSSALYNLLQMALEEMQVSATGTRTFVYGEARVPHESKIDLLKAAYNIGGATSILSIGRKISSYQSLLAISVLCRASSPLEAIKRWQRLERMYHSRHRVEVLEDHKYGLTVRHFAVDGQPPAQLADLLIAGILLSLLEKQGCQDITATFKNGDIFVQTGRVILEEISDNGDYSTWHFHWKNRSLMEQSATLRRASADGSLTASLKGVFMQDPANLWTVPILSERCGMSSRTLQRRLSSEGTSFRVLLREYRATAAAQMIANIDASLTDIAFASGYADHPHFTKEFKRCIGMLPSHYLDFVKPRFDA